MNLEGTCMDLCKQLKCTATGQHMLDGNDTYME